MVRKICSSCKKRKAMSQFAGVDGKIYKTCSACRGDHDPNQKVAVQCSRCGGIYHIGVKTLMVNKMNERLCKKCRAEKASEWSKPSFEVTFPEKYLNSDCCPLR